MDKRLNPDANQYPFMGADPVHVELNMEEIVALEEKAKNLDPDDGFSWEEAHKLLYFMTEAVRDYFKRELAEEEQFSNFIHDEKNPDKNTLLGTCIDATILTRILSFKMGLDVRSYHTDTITNNKADMHHHAFCVARIPIKDERGHVQEQHFVLDPTYRQFFADYSPQERNGSQVIKQGRKIKDPISNEENPISLGKRLCRKWAGVLMGDHILKYGFAFLGHSLGKRYLANFLFERTSWKQKHVSLDDFFRREATPDMIDYPRTRILLPLVESPLEIKKKTGQTPSLSEVCDVFPVVKKEKPKQGLDFT